jgi:predicted nucleic acid-binding protein
VIVFEVLAALRRIALGGLLDDERATDAVMDVGALPLSLFPSTPLRGRAWELRGNVAMADALFAALAEHLSEPLLTGDRRLCNAIATRPDLDVSVDLVAGD